MNSLEWAISRRRRSRLFGRYGRWWPVLLLLLYGLRQRTTRSVLAWVCCCCICCSCCDGGGYWRLITRLIIYIWSVVAIAARIRPRTRFAQLYALVNGFWYVCCRFTSWDHCRGCWVVVVLLCVLEMMVLSWWGTFWKVASVFTSRYNL